MSQIPDSTLITFSTETWPHLQEKWFILIASGLEIDTWEIQMTVERTNFSISAKGLIIYWLWLRPHRGDHKVTISVKEIRNVQNFLPNYFAHWTTKSRFTRLCRICLSLLNKYLPIIWCVLNLVRCTFLYY